MVKRGVENIYTNTIHYVISVSFTKGENMKILESSSERETKHRVFEIKTFISAKLKPGMLDLDDEGFEFSSI
jgi:hypothetical protein